MLTLPWQRREEEMIYWVAGEVLIVTNTVWQLNDNFGILAIEGVLSMLNNEGCQELSHLCKLATSSDASILQDVPDDVRKLVGQIMQRWWKPHELPEVLRRLEAANPSTISEVTA
jgi:hypothetical protein